MRHPRADQNRLVPVACRHVAPAIANACLFRMTLRVSARRYSRATTVQRLSNLTSLNLSNLSIFLNPSNLRSFPTFRSSQPVRVFRGCQLPLPLHGHDTSIRSSERYDGRETEAIFRVVIAAERDKDPAHLNEATLHRITTGPTLLDGHTSHVDAGPQSYQTEFATISFDLGFVSQVGSKPAFDFGQRHLLSLGIRFDLIFRDPIDSKVAGFGMSEVEPTDAGCR